MQFNPDNPKFNINGQVVSIAEMTNEELRITLDGLTNMTIDTDGYNDECIAIIQEEINNRDDSQYFSKDERFN